MSEARVSDPSKLHLKRELTQIRKAARALRDPGTTSSWKSPLNSSRSIAAAAAAAAGAGSGRRNLVSGSSKEINGSSGDLDAELPLRIEGEKKEKSAVFLYNWKAQKHPGDVAAPTYGESDGGGESSSSMLEGSLDSDARYNSSASTLCRRRDADLTVLGTPGIRRVSGIRKRSKKLNPRLDILSDYPRKEKKAFLSRNRTRGAVKSSALLNGNLHPSMASTQDYSAAQSDDTADEYSNSEDLRPTTGESPLLLKFKQKNLSHSEKLLKSLRKEDSSYTYSTPALSASSFNRYRNRNPSTIGSWDGTATSVNDGDDEIDDPLDLPGGQGCGIPCYWSKRTPKHRGSCRSCCSPSLSDTLRRKGSSIFCGSQSMYSTRRRSLPASKKRGLDSRSAQGFLPLLTNSGDGRGFSSVGNSDDELSTNFGEFDLEALSRLDGRRWSNCRSQDGLETLPSNGEGEEGSTPEHSKSFSQKYKPMFFDELIGQNIAVQSLANAISRGRIAPVYLFQGPRGTGKTCAARIFAAALNCLTTEETKPCGYCKECTDFISGKNRDIWEVDGTNKKGIDKVRFLLKNLSTRPPVPSTMSRYKVIIIDECHLLPSKTWLAFLKFVEDPPRRVVFIFITTDLDNVPRTVQSRCQKYVFSKIKDSDIATRLSKISMDENLEVESDALDLIALNADGSLRDAETMLEQLSLLGKRITTTMVNELVGVVSDEKLLDLLELAMSSDTAETVKRARELMDAGIDPLVLMSQLASLIMDIIAGTYKVMGSKSSESSLSGRTLNETELEKLKHALKLLSDAEKQLRVSNERPTWFTATLLQLGSIPSPEITQSNSSRRQSSRTTDEDPSGTSREYMHRRKSGPQFAPLRSASPTSSLNEINENHGNQGNISSRIDDFISKMKATHEEYLDDSASDASCSNASRNTQNFEKLTDIWELCIDRCHSKTLRQLLQVNAKLVSIAEAGGILVAYIAFADKDIKTRAERFMSSITNSIEIVLRRNVEVRTILLPDGVALRNESNLRGLPGLSLSETALTTRRDRRDTHHRGSFNDIENKLKSGILENGTLQPSQTEPIDGANGDKKEEIPMQRIESIIREQRLETAWLQATTEKGTPGSLNRMKPEKNQVLPQDGIFEPNQMESVTTTAFSSQNWEDQLNHELKGLKIADARSLQKDHSSKNHYPVSPSLLHDKSFTGNLNMESLLYESASGNEGCGAMFCWNTRPHKKDKVKRAQVRSRRSGRFSLFGRCVKPRPESSRLRRQTNAE